MAHPQRPPRGGRHNESSSAGLLVNVIRTLTTSASTEQRELEKKRLEHGYRDTGRTIDGLIAAHQEDLTVSLHSFRKVSQRITGARERNRNVRNNVSSCKSLLQCKRDELKKLWIESAEQKHVMQILDKIEKIKNVSAEAKEAIDERRFLKAAELLLSAGITLDDDLSVVEGLHEVRTNLNYRKEELYKAILNEIHRTLYLRPSEELMLELYKNTVSRSSDSLVSDPLSSETLLSESCCLKASEQDEPVLADNGCALEEDGVPDSSPVQYLAVLVEALAVMKRLPEAVEAVKHQIQLGLLKLMQCTTQFYHRRQVQVLDDHSSGGGDSRHLAELLHLLFRLFKSSVTLHRLLLQQLQRVCRTRHVDALLYSTDAVWVQVQIALQHMLNTYLSPVPGATSGARLTSSQPSTLALSSYFAKKRPTRPKKPSLFRFESTAHAINVNAFAKEQKAREPVEIMLQSAEELSRNEQVWICSPDPFNITAIYRPLSKFASEIQGRLPADGPCQLNIYLEGFVNDTFLPRFESDLKERADTALRSADTWQTLVGSEQQRQLGAPVPILASSARTYDLCVRVGDLMRDLPGFAERLAANWLLILNEYSLCSQSIYEQITRSVRQPDGMEPMEWRKISAAWAVDEDISRLLKSLPNWITLVIEPLQALQTPSLFSPPTAPATPMVESADEIRRRNQRESQILIGNLGTQKKIEDWEVISDQSHIRALATMHESLEWLCACVRRTLGQLPATTQARLKAKVSIRTTASDQPAQVEALDAGLERRLTALDDMAATCLLMLHLELRVHCFYHLLPLARQSSHVVTASQSQEADPRVLALNRDLVQLHELLKDQLLGRKVRYVFEGLGHLVSVIFIHSSHHITKINDNGKKRMCRNIFSLQQCLSGLTNSREPDLDTARKFFELLYRGPDEILNGIVEKGAKFDELEYQYLLALAIRSHPVHSTEPGALDQRINRLREIMADRQRK